ncbi:hypothetical protein [Streptomyces boluensis]|uniref:Uncharacterized protein n=1 Tax=Streptomyces boluensis TaxID=1775135 RepID=A0A964UW63_9ACTN|nr:hypothetical protein [Streptomyces boluensis]NBE56549.1 hypothetical protein [Streptomyces boluensis]
MSMRQAILSTFVLLGTFGTAGAVAATTGVTTGATTARTSAEPSVAASGWQRVGDDMRSGISGLAVTSHSGGAYRALIALDNKRPGENRIAQLTYHPGDSGEKAAVRPLDWKGGAEPIDLEALEKVPGTSDEYLAVASRGLVYHLELTADGNAVEVRDLSPLPAIGQGDNFESFTLVSLHGEPAAVWADRGEGDGRAATLYAAPLSFNKYGEPVFGTVTKAAYRAPYPTRDVRHASDISVTEKGRLLIASASDEGDDGPFDSAVADAGSVSLDGSGRVRLTVAKSPEVLGKFEVHKVEGVDCVPGSGVAVLGTDDENAGGAVTTARICD